MDYKKAVKENRVIVALALVAIIAQALDPAFLESLPHLPVDERSEAVVDWIQDSFKPAFNLIELAIKAVITPVDYALGSAHPLAVIAFFSALSYKLAGYRLSFFTAFAFLIISMMGFWQATMTTLAIVVASTFFSLLLGIPVGVLKAHSKTAELLMDPVLDLMQTLPSFVYLIPAVIIFKIGTVPGIVATFIFATPPAVRLTALGIKQIPEEIVEAGKAFGASRLQFLFKIELPLSMPSIMVGVNQTIMLSLSMVVIASMIGVEGLGQLILEGVQSLDIGMGIASGLAIVLVATVLDHITRHAWKNS